MKKILFCIALLLFSVQAQASYRELIESVKQGNLSGLLELLDNGEDVNATNEQGNTALHYAIALDNADITQVLLAYGADLNAANQKGWTPYSIAQKKQLKNVMPVIEKALQQQNEKAENLAKKAASVAEEKVAEVEKNVAIIDDKNVVETQQKVAEVDAKIKDVAAEKVAETEKKVETVEQKVTEVEKKTDELAKEIQKLKELSSQNVAKEAAVKAEIEKDSAAKAKNTPQTNVVAKAPEKNKTVPTVAKAKPVQQPKAPQKVVLQKSKLNEKIYAGDEEIVYCLNYLGHGENESMLRGAGFFAASSGINETRYKQIITEVENYLNIAKEQDLQKRNQDCGAVVTPKNIDKQNQIIRSINRGIGA